MKDSNGLTLETINASSIAASLVSNDASFPFNNALISKAASYLFTHASKLESLHSYRLASIVKSEGFTSTVVAASLLHSVALQEECEEEVSKEFGQEIYEMTKLCHKLNILVIKSIDFSNAESVRKMLFILTEDIRVIFIKLYDKLDRIRNIKEMNGERQRKLPKEIIQIWAPLCDRLGMQQVKNEMEDLYLKETQPDTFLQIKTLVSLKKSEREAYLSQVTLELQEAINKAGIKTEGITIEARAKHFYSIYKKMQKRNKGSSELFDLFATRIICNSKEECYLILGIVHSIYKPLENRFKDYIALPKDNGYQSLHTTVMAHDRPLEIQIRSKQMHLNAEHGAASHALYKDKVLHNIGETSNITLLNKLSLLKDASLNYSNTSGDPNLLFNELKEELLKDEIVVFTPRGDVKTLPLDSSSIDFAYSVHSDIGSHIVGAKVNGKIVPLSYKLQNTQIVEILTHPSATPKEEWLKIVKTAKAKEKIRSYIAQHLYNITPEPPISSRTSHSTHKKGSGASAIVHIGQGINKVLVNGDPNYLVTYAKCCTPHYPDVIAGYVSRLRGVTVHKASCLTFLNIKDLEARRVNVEWQTESS